METEEMGRGFQRDVCGPMDRQHACTPLGVACHPLRRGFSLLLIDGGVGGGRGGRSRPGGTHPHRPEDKDAADSPPGRRRLPSLLLFLPSVLMASRTQPSVCS